MRLKIKYIQFAKWFDKLPSHIKIPCYVAISGVFGIILGYLPIINSIDDFKALQSDIAKEMFMVIRIAIINVLLQYKLKTDSQITEITEHGSK